MRADQGGEAQAGDGRGHVQAGLDAGALDVHQLTPERAGGIGTDLLVGPHGRTPAPAVDLDARPHDDAVQAARVGRGGDRGHGAGRGALRSRAGAGPGVGLVHAEMDERRGSELVDQLGGPFPIAGVDPVERARVAATRRVDVEPHDRLDPAVLAELDGQPGAQLASHARDQHPHRGHRSSRLGADLTTRQIFWPSGRAGPPCGRLRHPGAIGPAAPAWRPSPSWPSGRAGPPGGRLRHPGAIGPAAPAWRPSPSAAEQSEASHGLTPDGEAPVGRLADQRASVYVFFS